MKFKCPNCSSPVDSTALRDGDRVVCETCRKRLKLPDSDHSMFVKTEDSDPSSSASSPRIAFTNPQPTLQPVPGQPPVMVIPVPVTHQPDALFQEQIEDLRESRSERQERRRYYNLDRKGNTIGMISFALAMTAFVVSLPGFLFVKDLPIFTLLVILFGLPVTMAAIPCGIIGSLKSGRNILFALIGAITSGFLFMVIYPALMLMLKNRWS